MRSRAEGALRALAWAALGWLLWTAVRPPGANGVGTVPGDGLALALAQWTVAPPADTMHLTLARSPGPRERAWLAALRRVGTAVTWEGTLVPLGLEIETRSDPAGGAVVRVAAPAGSRVTLLDGLGPIDSVLVRGEGATFHVPGVLDTVRAAVGVEVAWVNAGARPDPRRVAVFGFAGWESRFVVRALEERGYAVDARLVVAPDVAVVQGRPEPLDPARHGVVIVLDESGWDRTREIAAFVRQGGGLVLAGALPDHGLLPGDAAEQVRPARFTFGTESPPEALGFQTIRPRVDATALHVRNGAVAVAARRAGAGRVVQTGYRDTWRWRMSGPDGAPEAHRTWWAGLLTAAWPRDRTDEDAVAYADAAPLAATIDALGPQAESPPGTGRHRAFIPPWLVFATLLGALVAEWGLRRARGVP